MFNVVTRLKMFQIKSSKTYVRHLNHSQIFLLHTSIQKSINARRIYNKRILKKKQKTIAAASI
jgi:hypothetical protein